MEYNPFASSFIKSALQQNDLWLSGKRGQNYLIDGNIARKIVGEIPGELAVFEVGTGLGALTYLIAEEREVYSLEIDKGIVETVTPFLSQPRIRLIHGDVLKFDPDSLPPEQMVFVSNVPYSISGEVIRLFIEWKKFSEGIVMLQKEFVERMTSPPGGKNYGVLSILSQTFLEILPLFTVKRTAFFPEPGVDSTVVRIRKKGVQIDQNAFKEFLSAGFASRRKTLRNNMKRSGINDEQLREWGFDPDTRPERLSMEDWLKLYRMSGYIGS